MRVQQSVEMLNSLSQKPKTLLPLRVRTNSEHPLFPGQYEEVSMSPTKDTQKSAESTTTTGKKSNVFTAEERSAMRARARELKEEAARADGESAVLAKIAEMTEPDRTMAERLHSIVKANAPDLLPKTWYGMPAYANTDGKIICFYTPAEKFGTRYATFGFNDSANLDEGAMWPTAFALNELTAVVEASISALVKKAVS